MIKIVNIHKSFGSHVILQGINYHFPRGEKIALVGANGAGKTTLLNILCGLSVPDEGEVIKPNDVSLGFLPQEPNPNPEKTVLAECQQGATKVISLKKRMDDALKRLESDHSKEALKNYEECQSVYRTASGYSLESEACQILSGLGFSDEVMKSNPLDLSGGWRMRLELAKVFIGHPDFLVLDEPTNHLDLPSLVWMESYLAKFKGSLIYVSHDRTLLNRLSTQVLHLFKSSLKSYTGNFDDFLQAREEENHNINQRLSNIQKKKEHMEKFVERFGVKATKARQAQSRLKMIAKLQELEETIDAPDDEQNISISLPEVEQAGRVVLKLDDLTIGYDRPLASDMNLTVERGSKIAIIGANGIGKSTLLKTLSNSVKSLSGEYEWGYKVKTAYFSQDIEDVLDLDKSLLDNLLYSSDKITEKEARNLLGSFLFSGDTVFKEARALSGGEKSRVALARLLAFDANLLMLDEPTNHLDMSSTYALQEALQEYNGSLLFVSHNREFIDSICDHVFVMLPDGRSMLFKGNLNDYTRLAEKADFPNVLEISERKQTIQKDGEDSKDELSSNQIRRDKVKALKRDKNRLEKKLSKLEDEQKKLQAQIKELTKELEEDSSNDYEKLKEKNLNLHNNQSRLDEVEEEWLTFSEELEEIDNELATY